MRFGRRQSPDDRKADLARLIAEREPLAWLSRQDAWEQARAILDGFTAASQAEFKAENITAEQHRADLKAVDTLVRLIETAGDDVESFESQIEEIEQHQQKRASRMSRVRGYATRGA